MVASQDGCFCSLENQICMKWMLQSLLQHPLTKGLNIDDPDTTQLRRSIIQKKIFLKKIYEEWYTLLDDFLPADLAGNILELGSGAGFLKEIMPDAITSEIFYVSGIDVVLDGCELPFKEKTLSGILMTNVFHHLTDIKSFLKESNRCVRQGGIIAMIEPWVTPLSMWVYRNLHHEPCEIESKEWGFQGKGPLSCANSALAWIIFQRDKKIFESEFPQWKIQKIEPIMPFLYLLSGGVSLRSLQPGWSYCFWRRAENIFKPVWSKMAMFALIILRKN